MRTGTATATEFACCCRLALSLASVTFAGAELFEAAYAAAAEPSRRNSSSGSGSANTRGSAASAASAASATSDPLTQFPRFHCEQRATFAGSRATAPVNASALGLTWAALASWERSRGGARATCYAIARCKAAERGPSDATSESESHASLARAQRATRYVQQAAEIYVQLASRAASRATGEPTPSDANVGTRNSRPADRASASGSNANSLPAAHFRSQATTRNKPTQRNASKCNATQVNATLNAQRSAQVRATLVRPPTIGWQFIMLL